MSQQELSDKINIIYLLIIKKKTQSREIQNKTVTREQQAIKNFKFRRLNCCKTFYMFSGKHPVSLLGEYCSKRKFGAPVYELCFECGPDHKKNFLFKVSFGNVRMGLVIVFAKSNNRRTCCRWKSTASSTNRLSPVRTRSKPRRKQPKFACRH